MRYAGMPAVMWVLFGGSFQKHLVSDLDYDRERAKQIAKEAKERYRVIIEKLPEFEKGDRFKANIVNCALLTSFLLCMDRRPTVEELTVYYDHAVTNAAMRAFCRMAGKKKYTPEDIEGMKATAAFRAGDRNPYSWNMDFIPYGDGSGYEARFTACGICALMKEYGFFDLVPAMCRLDYRMSELGGVSDFVREYTLAAGGQYCDCGYKKKRT